MKCEDVPMQRNTIDKTEEYVHAVSTVPSLDYSSFHSFVDGFVVIDNNFPHKWLSRLVVEGKSRLSIRRVVLRYEEARVLLRLALLLVDLQRNVHVGSCRQTSFFLLFAT